MVSYRNWLVPGLLMASLAVVGVLVFHIVTIQSDRNSATLSHFASAHDKALTGLVEAVSMIKVLYDDNQRLTQAYEPRCSYESSNH